MKKYMLLLILSAPTLTAQVVVKQTPASDALTQAAKEAQSEQKSYDTALQQGKLALTAEQKTPLSDLAAAQADLDTKLKSDKKYKPLLDRIAMIEAQLKTLTQAAQTKFATTIGPVQGRLALDKAAMDALVPIVRKENALADSVKYDENTQTWKDTSSKK